MVYFSFWAWSVDGTVGSCYECVASVAKEEEEEEEGRIFHLKLINSGSEKKKSFIYAQVSFAKYNLVTSN